MLSVYYPFSDKLNHYEMGNCMFIFSKRMSIYTFLLQNMTDEYKFQVTAKLCQEVKLDRKYGHNRLVLTWIAVD